MKEKSKLIRDISFNDGYIGLMIRLKKGEKYTIYPSIERGKQKAIPENTAGHIYKESKNYIYFRVENLGDFSLAKKFLNDKKIFKKRKNNPKLRKINPFAVCTESIGKTQGTTKRSLWPEEAIEKYESCKSKLEKGQTNPRFKNIVLRALNSHFQKMTTEVDINEKLDMPPTVISSLSQELVATGDLIKAIDEGKHIDINDKGECKIQKGTLRYIPNNPDNKKNKYDNLSDSEFHKIVKKYGWSAKKNSDGDYELFNRLDKKVVILKIKDSKYIFYDTGNNKIMSGKGQLSISTEKLLRDYYYAITD